MPWIPLNLHRHRSFFLDVSNSTCCIMPWLAPRKQFAPSLVALEQASLTRLGHHLYSVFRCPRLLLGHLLSRVRTPSAGHGAPRTGRAVGMDPHGLTTKLGSMLKLSASPCHLVTLLHRGDSSYKSSLSSRDLGQLRRHGWCGCGIVAMPLCHCSKYIPVSIRIVVSSSNV